MNLRISLGNGARQSLQRRLERAISSGDKQLARRVVALLLLDQDVGVAETARAIGMGEQTVRDAVKAFLLEGEDSLQSQRRPGRPPRLSGGQRKELASLVEAGPEACGYESGCWSSLMLADLIERRFGVHYHPHYVCQLLKSLGFSFQKARFTSNHLNEVARHQWKSQLWPQIVALAKAKKATILFGDEASFAQWGSLSYTWAPLGQQPTVRTSGKRRGYKVFGLIDVLSGDFYYKGQEDRFNSESYEAFLQEVLDVTEGHIILVHDRVRYHTSAAMQQFYTKNAARLSVFGLPSYSPDFNPIEFLWKKVKKRATHLRYFAEFQHLIDGVEDALFHFAGTPSEIKSLLGQYCETLGELAAAA